jgi:hypothetical protein
LAEATNGFIIALCCKMCASEADVRIDIARVSLNGAL